MALLALASQIVHTVRHRRAIQSLAELDDDALADVGLLRSDVHAALSRPYLADPFKVLQAACCGCENSAARLRASPEPRTCC